MSNSTIQKLNDNELELVTAGKRTTIETSNFAHDFAVVMATMAASIPVVVAATLYGRDVCSAVGAAKLGGNLLGDAALAAHDAIEKNYTIHSPWYHSMVNGLAKKLV